MKHSGVLQVSIPTEGSRIVSLAKPSVDLVTGLAMQPR